MNFSRDVFHWSVCSCRLSALDIDKPETIHVYITVGNSNNDTYIYQMNCFVKGHQMFYPFIKQKKNRKNLNQVSKLPFKWYFY